MPNKLYYSNQFNFEFTADVLDIIKDDNKFNVVLSETAFYPEGGGQPSDTGTIDGTYVSYVYEKDDKIYHVMESSPINKTVKCTVDYKRRFDIMQQHTGQHLLSAVFYNLLKGETSSFHLGDDIVSIDISLNEISLESLNEVENTTNNYIFRNLKILTHVVDYSNALNFPLRKLPPATDNIRIVEIDGIDFSPCCGTHLISTGMLGIIKIVKTEKYKGVTRVYFKCGDRALLDYRKKSEIISNIQRKYSISQDEILQRLENEAIEVKNLTKKLHDTSEIILNFKADEIIKSAKSAVISILFEDITFDEVQNFSRNIISKGSFILILSSIKDNKLLFSNSSEYDINCGRIFKENLSRFSGRGGGNEKQAQGSFKTTTELKEFSTFLKTLLKT